MGPDISPWAILIAAVFVQALLLLALLITHKRKRQAELECQRLATEQALAGEALRQAEEENTAMRDALTTNEAQLAGARQAVDRLRESEQRFRNMADTAPIMIWVANPDIRCTYVNKHWLDFTGRTAEE